MQPVSFSFPPPSSPAPALESSPLCPGNFYTSAKNARKVIVMLTPGDRQCTSCQNQWNSVTAFTNSDHKHQNCGPLCKDMCNGCRARVCDGCHRSVFRWASCRRINGRSCLISCSKKEKRSKKRKRRSSMSAGESGSTLLWRHMSLSDNLLPQEQAGKAPEPAARAGASMQPAVLFEDEHQRGVSVKSCPASFHCAHRDEGEGSCVVCAICIDTAPPAFPCVCPKAAHCS